MKHCAIYHGSFLASRYCFACAMPKRVCLCGKIAPDLKSTPNITILRHPSERKQTLSTVSLIKQRYPNVLVKDGERFTEMRGTNLVCLYPEPNADQRAVVPDEADAETYSSDSGSAVHYLLIDATWKKSKRMLHENPWLAKLPRQALVPAERSYYLIRKVPDPKALSTLESFALACSDEQLIDLFKQFMDVQLRVMGRKVYEQNYRHYLNFADAKA